MTGAPPSVHVLILHWGDPEVTACCLRSLQASSYAQAEVVIIDNGTPDRSGEPLRQQFPEFTHIRNEENLGFAGGNNVGLLRALDAEADFVLLLNNDAEVESDTIATMIDSAQADPRIGLMNPKILYHDPKELIWFAGGEHSLWKGHGQHVGRGEMDQGQHNTPAEASFTTGCALLVRRECLREIGTLDDTLFMYAEDLDWSLRARERGWKLWYEPNATVIHREPVQRRKTVPDPFRLRLGTRNAFTVNWRHASTLQRFSLMFYLGVRWVGYLTVKNIVQGFPGDALAVWKGFFDFLQGRGGPPPR